MEIGTLTQIFNSDYLTVGIVLGVTALFAWLFVPRYIAQFKQRLAVKEKGIAETLGSFAVIIRDGEILKKTKGRFTVDGALKADNKLWPLSDVKPYFLKEGWQTRPCFIVDARMQVYYRFNNIDNEKQRQLAGHASDPAMLKRFTDSTIVQKLASAKPDKTMMIMMLLMGMVIFFVVQQFIPK